MGRKYSNNYSSTISTASVGASDTTLDVTSATGLPAIPAGDYALLTLVDSLSAPTKMEVVKCTNVTGSTLTIERGLEDTSGVAWASGDFIELRATKTSFSQLDGTNINRYTETVNLSANVAIDRADGGIQLLTFTQNDTVTISIENGESLLLHVVNAATWTITWPSITWIGGAEPAFSDNCAITFWKFNGVLYAAYAGSF